MRALLLICFAIISLLFVTATRAQESNWYATVKPILDDPFYFQHIDGSHFRKGITLGGTPNTVMYAVMSKDEFVAIKKAAGKTVVIDAFEITDENRQFFVDHFRKLSNEVRVPFFLRQGANVINPFLGNTMKILDIMLNGLNHFNKENTVQAAELAGTIANGGRFERTLTIFEDKVGKPYINQITQYHVQIGKEQRIYIISKGTFALKVIN